MNKKKLRRKSTIELRHYAINYNDGRGKNPWHKARVMQMVHVMMKIVKVKAYEIILASFVDDIFVIVTLT